MNLQALALKLKLEAMEDTKYEASAIEDFIPLEIHAYLIAATKPVKLLNWKRRTQAVHAIITVSYTSTSKLSPHVLAGVVAPHSPLRERSPRHSKRSLPLLPSPSPRSLSNSIALQQ
jgi:hypothetical protein